MSVINNLSVDGEFTGITTSRGDILANNGSSNAAFPVATDGYILSSDSTQPFGLRWIPNSGGGGPVTVSTEINLQPFNFATNDTTPTIISNLSYTGLSGTTLFIGTLNCTLNHARHYFTVGMYLNGTLITGTQKTYGGIDNVIFPVSIHQTVNLLVTDTLTVRINVDNSNCQVSVNGVSPYNNSAVINASTEISINTITPYTLNDFTFSGASGIIAIIVNMNCTINHARSTFVVGVYKNGVLIPGTSQTYGGIDTLIIPVAINIYLDLTTTDVITFCINSDSTQHMVSIFERTLIRDTYISGMVLTPQISLSGPVFATTDTNPIAISDLTLTGISGNLLIIGELNCMLTKGRGYYYIGLYKNGSLIAYSNKKYGGVDNIRIATPFLTSVPLVGTDIFEVKVWLAASSYELDVFERSLMYITY